VTETPVPDRDQPGPPPPTPPRDPYAYVPPDPTWQPPPAAPPVYPPPPVNGPPPAYPPPVDAPPPYGQPAYGGSPPPPPSYGQPPYGTPPPGQSPYGVPGQPGYGMPGQLGFVPARPQDGFSVAAFVLSLMAFVPVAVPLAIVALVRIGRSGARGKVLAILALVISGLWALLIALIVVAVMAFTPDRDSTGAVSRPQSIGVDDLQVGDCLVEVPGTTTAEIEDVDVTPCANPHRGEVYAEFDLPNGRYAGVTATRRRANDSCDDRLPDAVHERRDIDFFALFPTEDGWRYQDRTVTCIAISESKPLTGRLVP